MKFELSFINILHVFQKKDRNMLLTDISGKTLPAKRVFALAIQFLVEDLLAFVNNSVLKAVNTTTAEQSSESSESREENADAIKLDDVKWVLTVPAIWDDAAKQFMREAANEVMCSLTYSVL